ncbi:MAG: hypothetical protein JWO13_1445 [Acidobacteriales bacterium]|nr:hypothetical protein [Terriglobales bacterium]
MLGITSLIDPQNFSTPGKKLAQQMIRSLPRDCTQKTLWKLVFSIGLLLTAVSSSAQSMTDNLNNPTFTIPLTFPTLTPGSASTLLTRQASFRIRCNCAAGYHLRATLNSFTFTPAGASAGAADIQSSDIGMGIVAATLNISGSEVITPRTDTVAAGFNYNPATAPVTNGLTPFGGVGAVQATLASIAVGNVNILGGPQIATNELTNPGHVDKNFVGVTITFAALPQYWTPGTVNAVITLQIVSP